MYFVLPLSLLLLRSGCNFCRIVSLIAHVGHGLLPCRKKAHTAALEPQMVRNIAKRFVLRCDGVLSLSSVC